MEIACNNNKKILEKSIVSINLFKNYNSEIKRDKHCFKKYENINIQLIYNV